MKKIMLSLILFASVFGVFAPAVASAEPAVRTGSCYQGFLGIPHWYEYLELDTECQVVGPNNSDGNLDIPKVVTRVALAVIDILMRIGGMVAFGFIVYSGFRFVMSQGNPDQEKAARETAINALIGMVITIFAIVLVTYIGRQIAV